jgi:hypothetical protein
MTIQDVISKMPQKSYKSKANYKAAVFRFCVKTHGIEPLMVTRDKVNNCTVCGESARCIGLHLLEEIKF